jgi:hypothetical protein
MFVINAVKRLLGIDYPIRPKIPLDKILVPGLERVVLWDYKNDSIPVWQYIRELQQFRREILYSRKRYPEVYRHLKLIKHNMMEEYEKKIDRIWNDQRTGTFFKKGDRFEPHQIEIKHNLEMWDGLTGYTEFISGESTDYFIFMAGGLGTSEPTFDNTILEIEKVRVNILEVGDINSDGIVLKSTAAFPPGVPSDNYTEFGGFDQDSDGRMEYRVVTTTPLGQIQDVTFMQASHNTVFQAVRTEV